VIKSMPAKREIGLPPSAKRSFKQSDNPILNDSLEKPDPPEPSYGQDDIFVGWKKGSSDHWDTFKEAKWQEHDGMDAQAFKEALHMFKKRFEDKSGSETEELDPMFLDQGSASVSFRAGERGAGKSFTLRGEGNRSAKSEILTIHVDPAHEYYTNNHSSGVQNEIVESSAGLRKGEDAQPIETPVLMPDFIKKARDKAGLSMSGKTWTTVFQFSLQDLDSNDLSHILLKDVDRNSDTAKFKDFQKYLSELNQKIENEDDFTDFSDAKKLAKKMQRNKEFSYNERASQIEDEFELYEDWNFIGDKTIEEQDFSEFVDEDSDKEDINSWAKLLNTVNCMTLSLEDDDECPDHLMMKQFYIAVLIKRIRSLRKQGVYDRPTNWIIDEIHRFVDDDDYDSREDAPLAHWEIRKIIKEDRKIGFRLSMASQQVGDIPEENFLKQTDHMFIPMNMDKDDRRYLLQLYDIYSQGDNSRNKWKRVYEAMNEYEWFYMRKKTKEWALLVPPAPLSNHLSE
jgi:hypothetical protein